MQQSQVEESSFIPRRCVGTLCARSGARDKDEESKLCTRPERKGQGKQVGGCCGEKHQGIISLTQILLIRAETLSGLEENRV